MEGAASDNTLICISSPRINSPQACVICTELVPVTNTEVVLLYCSCSKLLHVPCAEAFSTSSMLPTKGRLLKVACPLCRRETELVVIKRNAENPENPDFIRVFLKPPPVRHQEEEEAAPDAILETAIGVSEDDDGDSDYDGAQVDESDDSDSEACSLFEESVSDEKNDDGSSEASSVQQKTTKRLKRCKTHLVVSDLQTEN